MHGKPYKALLAVLAIVCFLGASFAQRELVKEREALGLTRYTELKGAPPMLAMTTVALGGFRGLISNLLWIRANDLQQDDKFFEMVQLSDWITKLEPHFSMVWTHLAWNMAYNITVKFSDPADRWRWLERGIELLRDEGLKYNPDDVSIHRELAWFFQHKMGANLDDAQFYYKQMWANEMSKIFQTNRPNWDELINPQTDDAKKRTQLLREKYKMDPQFMKEVDEHYGPLEWRLPEAHAIYWAAQGLEAAKRDPRRINPDDLITLRRVVYQSMQLSFQRGRLVVDNPEKHFEYAPNLDIIPKVSAAYEQAMDEDAKNKDHIETAHRNFLRDAVYMLYVYDRQRESAQWYKYLSDKYPNKALIEKQPNSLPKVTNLPDYVLGRIEDEWDSPGQDKAKGIIEGLLTTSFRSLALGEDSHAQALELLAQKLWNKFNDKIGNSGKTQDRIGLPPFNSMKREILNKLLDGGLSPELAAVLATKTGQKWPREKKTETAVLPPPPEKSATNKPSTNAVPADKTLF